MPLDTVPSQSSPAGNALLRFGSLAACGWHAKHDAPPLDADAPSPDAYLAACCA